MKKDTPDDSKSSTLLNHLSRYGDQAIHGLKRVQHILAQETAESKEMLETYAKTLANAATPEEVQKANKQFVDLIKTVGLGTLFILPGGVVTLPLTIAAAKKMGVNILPDSFKAPVEKTPKEVDNRPIHSQDDRN